jgi:hypothetical protein
LLIFSALGVLLLTSHNTCEISSVQNLDFVLQAVAVLLLAIAAWVGRHGATTSKDVLATLEEVVRRSDTDLPTAGDFTRRRRSTRGTTST